MCWVMPPASPAATSVSRIASSSEVLPWSTWPMIVTTGGRSVRSSSASANCGSSGSSSAAVTISSLRSYSSAIARIDSSVSVWVSVAISPIIISFLITSAGASPSSSATSRTVAPELTLVASGSAGVAGPSGGSSSSGRRRRPPRRRGGRCGGGPPIWSRRAACESITTRRFFAATGAAALRCARRAHRFGRRGLGRGFALSGFRLGRFRGRFRSGSRSGFRGGLGRRVRGLRGGSLRGRFRLRLGTAVALGGGDRLQRIGLLDARSGGFGLDAGGLQRRQQLLAS